MKITNRMMASAIVLAVGLSTASAALVTNDWFTVDFESYTANAIIAGVSQAGGAWAATIGTDVSSMTNYPAKGKIGKIDTQEGELKWLPTNAAAGGKAVLLDADVYMVGSEDAPGVSSGTVQTEVFMTNVSESVSYLCAHVGDGGAGSKWVKLQGVAVSDMTWIHLRIEINYFPATPEVSFIVDGILMSDGTSTAFPVMAAGADENSVNSVSFMGTGYFDNFVGKTVVALPSVEVGGVTADTEGHVSGVTGGVVDNIGSVTATFATSTGDGAIQYVQLKGGSYVRTLRTTGGTAIFNTANLPVGTYSITAFYGAAAPSLAAGTDAPAAATVGPNKASEVVGGNISFTVAPISGLYYTLFAGPNPTSLTAGAASVLASPDNQDAGFLKLAMPVPATANEVKIIKIYASDESFAKDAAAPTNE